MRKNHGGVLIEFAFSIPILISLLFFVNDHYRMYELKEKIKASAYLAASMIQQIGNTRADKQLTRNDIANITCASCINLFHTTSMFAPWPLGLFYVVDYQYVKRLSSDSYQVQESWGDTQVGNSPSSINAGSAAIQIKTKNQIAQQYHPDMVCDKDGDERLLMRVCYRKAPGFTKSKIGLFFLDINSKTSTYGNYFRYSIIITPKPGLFPVKN